MEESQAYTKGEVVRQGRYGNDIYSKRLKATRWVRRNEMGDTGLIYNARDYSLHDV